MPPKRKRPLESTGNQLIPTPAPSNFLANLCNFHIPQSDLREFSHKFVNKLLIPELLKCTKTPGKQKQSSKVTNGRIRAGRTNKLVKKPSDQTVVPGYRIAQCIDVSSRLPADSRRSPKAEHVAKANIPSNKKRPEPSAARPKTAPSKSSPPVRTSARNEKTKLTKQKCDEVLSVAKIDGISDSSLARAIEGRNGDLMISEIIIKFCRNE